MKNIKALIAGLCGVTLLTAACADADYTDKYANPSQTTTVTCDKLMSGAFYYGRQYTFNSYWRMYTWDNGIIGKYAQTIGFTNAQNAMWSAQDSYVNDRWNNFYGILVQYRVLQQKYEAESADEQANDKIFLDLTEVFLYDQLSQMLDAFGDIPFEKAGYLGITGDVVGSYAAYDDDETLYPMIIDRLGELSTEIHSLAGSLATTTASALPRQDFYNHGDLTRWEMYANALRLRCATRLALKGGATAKAQAAIADILNNNRPLPTSCEGTTDWTAGDNIVATPDLDGFNYWENFRDGYKDHSRANQAMLDVLLAGKNGVDENDPRLPVMYSTNAAGEYKGLSWSETLAEQETNVALGEDVRVYSRIDSTLFYQNQNMLSPIITVAEVDFLKAEAYQRGWASGDAASAFRTGVWHSTQWQYMQNMNSNVSFGYTATEVPDEIVVRSYAQKVWDSASDKVKEIIHQRWFNYGFYQPSQAWAEVRRYGYSNCTWTHWNTDATAQLLKDVPNRVRIPQNEANNNKANYEAAYGSGDDAYTKLFWAY